MHTRTRVHTISSQKHTHTDTQLVLKYMHTHVHTVSPRSPQQHTLTHTHTCLTCIHTHKQSILGARDSKIVDEAEKAAQLAENRAFTAAEKDVVAEVISNLRKNEKDHFGL
jgi:hypothetical protein